MNIKHDRTTVLKTGLGLLCNQGYNSLGIDEICRVTKMTKGAFYNAFKSKEQFLITAMDQYATQNVARIQKALQPSSNHTAFERLEKFYIQMLQAQPKVNFMGCFINNIMAELGTQNNAVGHTATIAFNQFIDAIAPTILEAQNNQELSTEWSPRQLSELIHSTFYGVLTIAKSAQDQKQSIQIMQLLFNNLKIK